MHHVIIGTGPAGVIAAEALRKLDPASNITLIGEEPKPPYSRMAIPYYLSNRIDERGTYLRKAANHFESRDIEIRHDRVTGVLPESKMIFLRSGGELSYDRLLIATGSHPITPPVPGIDLPGVHSCWTLEDARNIARVSRPGAKVVLMGAGFIGCIILEALAARGTDLTVVELENRMVPRMMNDRAGNLIKRWCEHKGVKVHTTTRVEGIERSQHHHPLAAKLDNGRTLDADLVIFATGVRPNIEFLQGSGIQIDYGVLVNERLEASLPDVYAAGDVAQGLDFSTGQYTVQAIQPTAAEHGRIAATNMAGRTLTHRGTVNMNVLDTMGLISCSFGLWMGVNGNDSVELYDPERFRYLNLQFEEDRLIGASSLGHTEHVGVIRGLIQSKIRLKEWKDRLMRNPTRLMEAYLARTQAPGYNARVMS